MQPTALKMQRKMLSDIRSLARRTKIFSVGQKILSRLKILS